MKQAVYQLQLTFLYSALTTALVVRLGHHLGANQPKKTKLCVILVSTIGLVFVFINSILLYVNRSAIAHTFSKDDQVIDAVIELLGVGSLAHFAMVRKIPHFIRSSVTLPCVGFRHRALRHTQCVW